MSQPRIVAKEPMVMELEPGTYWWCACGRSAKHPFCDGSHEGLGIQPVRFEVTGKRTVALCQCKATGKPPFCDGSHAAMDGS